MYAQRDIRPGWAPSPALAVWLAGMTLSLAACVDNEIIIGPRPTASAEETFSLQADATGRTTFRLTGINGNIVVIGASNTQAVSIEGIRRVESSSQSDAEDNLSNLLVEVSQTAAEVSVRTSQPQDTQNRNFVVDYEITVPAGLFVQVTNVNGGVTVTDIQNTVNVVNANGNISLQRIAGSVDVDLVNGNIDAEATPPAGGALTLASVNGNLSLDVPVTVSAELSMNLTNGTMSVVNLTVQNQASSATSLTGTLGAGDGQITLATVNGNIMITGS